MKSPKYCDKRLNNMFFGSKSTENKGRFEEKLHLTGKSKKFQIKM